MELRQEFAGRVATRIEDFSLVAKTEKTKS